MINLQKEFIEFHNKIKLDESVLREKRNILLNKLKNNICDEAAKYTHFNQGSYAMGTGIKPEDEDYDIDVGLKFNIDKDDYSDPVEPKKWVRDALDGHTKSVEIRRSCVTVTYQKEEEPLYHVDFAIYASENKDGKIYIAKGKEYSSDDLKFWELTDPQGLIEKIKEKYSGDDAAQFRRVIRYLKKWKSHNFTTNGNAMPIGIGLTVLAFNHFECEKKIDWAKNKDIYDDFTALYNLAVQIKDQFIPTCNNEYHTISVNLPVEPYNDLFDDMTEKQMESFYQKLIKMIDKLDKVKTKDKRSDACSIMVDIFGEDFPVTVDKSTVGTSESALCQ